MKMVPAQRLLVTQNRLHILPMLLEASGVEFVSRNENKAPAIAHAKPMRSLQTHDTGKSEQDLKTEKTTEKSSRAVWQKPHDI